MSFLHGSATPLRLTSFLHGSDWSRTTSHNIVCNRQDTFLVSHGIVPECLLHSNRQLNSIPRLLGQIRLFLRNFIKHIKHVPSLMFSSVKRALCDGFHGNFTNQLNRMTCVCHTWATLLASVEYGNCLITNLSPHSQTELFHIARIRFSDTSGLHRRTFRVIRVCAYGSRQHLCIDGRVEILIDFTMCFKRGLVFA